MCHLRLGRHHGAAGAYGAELSPVSMSGLWPAVQRAPRRRAEPDFLAQRRHRPRLVVFFRLRYRLTLHYLREILALRRIEVSHEAVRDWETKLLPVMGDALRKRRYGTRRSSKVS